ncbi:MAG: AAA family ATPase [Proteobacteria bacterium]|nr:AAA family ATPase [Pseudomonadota bacterium]
MDRPIADLASIIRQNAAFIPGLKAEIGRVIVGQHHMVDRAIIALLTGGHLLLEGVPGLAKTLLCNTLARVVDCQFQRIQFTPDLLPADLIGSLAYRQDAGEFYVKKGPIFANLILADEINRAPAKVQSALLEAMEERQVTIGETTYSLPSPFFVIATQNPIDQEGTYALPEAQVDRFMMKIVVSYPSLDEEKQILERMTQKQRPLASIMTSATKLITASQHVESVYIDDRVRSYIVNLVYATRQPEQFGLPQLKGCVVRGASPRATLSLARAAKARAFMETRAFVTPDDVQELAIDVLQHRISMSYEAEADNILPVDIIGAILGHLEVP